MCFLEHRPSHGERPRLIQHNHILRRQPGQTFERLAAFKQHTELRAASHGHSERGGNGQTHGARAGDDENGNCVGEGER